MKNLKIDDIAILKGNTTINKTNFLSENLQLFTFKTKDYYNKLSLTDINFLIAIFKDYYEGRFYYINSFFKSIQKVNDLHYINFVNNWYILKDVFEIPYNTIESMTHNLNSIFTSELNEDITGDNMRTTDIKEADTPSVVKGNLIDEYTSLQQRGINEYSENKNTVQSKNESKEDTENYEKKGHELENLDKLREFALKFNYFLKEYLDKFQNIFLISDFTDDEWE